MKRALSAAAVLLIVIVGSVIYLVAHFGGKNDGGARTDLPQTIAVRRGLLKAAIVENGVLKAKHSEYYTVEFDRRYSSEAKIAWIADEGKMVKAGELIALIDKAPFETSLQDLEKRIEDTDAEIKQLEVDAKMKELERERKRSELSTQLELAKLALKNLEEGEGKLRQDKAQADRDKSKAALERKRRRMDDMKTLHAENFITDEELNQAKLEVDEAKEAFALADADLEVFKKFTLPMELRKARAEVDKQEAEVKRFEAACREEDRSGKYKLRSKQSRLEKNKKNKKKIEDSIAKCEIRARVSGFVIRSKNWYGGGRRKIQVGDRVWPGQFFIEQPDLSAWIAVMTIREIDLHRVRGRDPEIKVRMDAFPDRVFSAKISNLGVLGAASPDPGSRRPASNSFPLEVELLAPKSDKAAFDLLRPGMTARVEIITSKKENALLVPEQAVHEDDKGPYVLVISKQNPRGLRTDIVRGESDGDMVEARKGLDEGEKVVLGGFNGRVGDE